MKLEFSADVRKARKGKKAIVALESTLITHGLPQPENGRVASMLEQAARESGATPATIALINGKPRIGLDAKMLGELASHTHPRKCSLRDLPIAMARKETGGTTVASTMYLAHAAGIGVFATGGIGGVHRGQPFDVSNDLTALGSIPMTVVCAGAKSILDLPLTLEVLETNGVTVVGFRTDEFPAFYCRTSGLPVDIRCESAREIADIIRARDQAGLTQAVLVVNPIPEAYALPPAATEKAILRALAAANKAGIKGKEVTPYLLAKMSSLTEKKSMKANLALLENNVKLASAIARELA